MLAKIILGVVISGTVIAGGTVAAVYSYNSNDEKTQKPNS